MTEIYHCHREGCKVTVAALQRRIAELESKVNQFETAVSHVTEDGKITRSYSSSEGWTMLNRKRHMELVIAEGRRQFWGNELEYFAAAKKRGFEIGKQMAIEQGYLSVQKLAGMTMLEVCNLISEGHVS